jgi:RNA polymerase sigma factor (sigma-70 family)
MYEYDSIINWIVCSRSVVAEQIGMHRDELMAVGRLSAVQAVDSWEPDGGRTLASWVRLNVRWDICSAIYHESVRFARELRDEDYEIDEGDLDTAVLVRQSLDLLQAKLSSLDWTILWMAYAEGRKYSEIADDLGISGVAMRQKMSRARKKVVTILGAHGIGISGEGFHVG